MEFHAFWEQPSRLMAHVHALEVVMVKAYKKIAIAWKFFAPDIRNLRSAESVTRTVTLRAMKSEKRLRKESRSVEEAGRKLNEVIHASWPVGEKVRLENLDEVTKLDHFQVNGAGIPGRVLTASDKAGSVLQQRENTRQEMADRLNAVEDHRARSSKLRGKVMEKHPELKESSFARKLLGIEPRIIRSAPEISNLRNQVSVVRGNNKNLNRWNNRLERLEPRLAKKDAGLRKNKIRKSGQNFDSRAAGKVNIYYVVDGKRYYYSAPGSKKAQELSRKIDDLRGKVKNGRADLEVSSSKESELRRVANVKNPALSSAGIFLRARLGTGKEDIGTVRKVEKSKEK
ncbi:MAG TPA: hypothetical protein VLE46_00825 [Nitrospira sp.]|nr:hypothetical protein [Nitrospira sp.]